MAPGAAALFTPCSVVLQHNSNFVSFLQGMGNILVYFIQSIVSEEAVGIEIR